MISHIIRGKKVFEDEIEALKVIGNELDNSFDEAVEAMRKAINSGHKIIIVGVGKSGLIGLRLLPHLPRPVPPPWCLIP